MSRGLSERIFADGVTQEYLRESSKQVLKVFKERWQFLYKKEWKNDEECRKQLLELCKETKISDSAKPAIEAGIIEKWDMVATISALIAVQKEIKNKKLKQEIDMIYKLKKIRNDVSHPNRELSNKEYTENFSAMSDILLCLGAEEEAIKNLKKELAEIEKLLLKGHKLIDYVEEKEIHLEPLEDGLENSEASEKKAEADFYVEAEIYMEALAIYNDILRSYKLSTSDEQIIFYNRFAAYLMLDKKCNVLEKANELTKKWKSWWGGYHCLAHAYAKQGKWSHVKEFLQNALKMNPTSKKILHDLEFVEKKLNNATTSSSSNKTPDETKQNINNFVPQNKIVIRPQHQQQAVSGHYPPAPKQNNMNLQMQSNRSTYVASQQCQEYNPAIPPPQLQRFPTFNVPSNFVVKTMFDLKFQGNDKIKRRWNDSKEIPKNLEITEELVLLNESLTVVIPKIAVCKAKVLIICEQPIYYEDFKILTERGTVVTFCTFNVSYKRKNSGAMFLDDIFQCLPCLEYIRCYRYQPWLRPNNVQIISPPRNFKVLYFESMSWSYNLGPLISFMEKNKHINYRIEYIKEAKIQNDDAKRLKKLADSYSVNDGICEIIAEALLRNPIHLFTSCNSSYLRQGLFEYRHDVPHQFLEKASDFTK